MSRLVMLVDDDANSLAVARAVIEGLGYQVAVFQDGLAAWESFSASPVGIVITDWMMPRMDGIELCERIRGRDQRPPTHYTYVIILTALTDRESFKRGMAAGADDFLVKPLDPDMIQARLRVADRILGLRSQVSQLEELLPICSYCKRIRSDEDQWEELENYVATSTETTLSHGVCPDCYEKWLKTDVEGT